MKKCIYVFTVFVVLNTLAWGQTSDGEPVIGGDGIRFYSRIFPASPEAAAREKETNIMSGILRSELESHLKKFTDTPDMHGIVLFNSEFPSYSANEPIWFYLQEQGIVFTIPIYGVRNSPQMLTTLSNIPIRGRLFNTTQPKGDTETDRIHEIIGKLEAEIQAPGASHEDMVAMRGKINTLKKELSTLQELQTSFANLDEYYFQRLFTSLRDPLVDVLAKYGDSLSVVKPDEYINLVLYTPSLLEISGRQQRVEVISARKSWIKDYKEGRITLDEFREKVLK